MAKDERGELTRTTLGVLSIGGLLAASFWIARPFLGSLIWATMIAVATWPLLVRLQRWTGGRRSLAVALISLAMLLVFVVPFWIALSTAAEFSDEVGAWTSAMSKADVPRPPDFVEGIPLVGSKVSAFWRELAAEGWAGLAEKLKPYVGLALKWLVSEAGTVGMLMLQFLVTVVIAAVMQANGEGAARMVLRFGRRLAGERGEQVVILASQAIRGVALGVVGTALVQSVLGGIGLAVVGIPAAGALTVLMLVLCLAQLGPLLVLLPVVGWLYWTGDNLWASVLLVWSLLVGTLDNVLRPMLIKMGADLPLLLIFAGVVGGLVSFGLVGIFIGPVVLAVTFTLLQSWIDEVPEPAGPAGAEPSDKSFEERP